MGNSCGATKVPKSTDTPKEIPHVFNANYKLGEVLGQGAYSTVKLAIHKYKHTKVAVKIVNRQDLSTADEDLLKQEVSIMQRLQHNHIIQLFDFFEEEKFYYLVLEYMDGGELFDRIVKKTSYNEKEARDVVRILVDALNYCHSKGIVHRDLKPENLLLTSKSDDANLKIADFGFAIQENGNFLSTQCGTPGYIAPEILERKPYGREVDMWSIGVITYILLGGYPPFHDDNMRKLFKKIKKGEFTFHVEYWKNISTEAKDLISGLLTVDTKKRLTAQDVLKHPWLLADDAKLSAIPLTDNLNELKRYNAARRWKKGYNAVKFMLFMQQIIAEKKNTGDDKSDTQSDVDDANTSSKGGNITVTDDNDDSEQVRTGEKSL